MWIAFVWGFGCSCGAAFGLLLFIAGYWCLEYVTGRAARIAEAAGINEKSLQALVRRNELSAELLVHVAGIAAAARKYEEGK